VQRNSALTTSCALLDFLSQVPYNTLIDYFIMVSTLALAVTAFLSVLPNFITDAEQSKQANVALAVTSLVLVNVGLCAWLIAAYMVAHKPKKIAPVVYVEGRNWSVTCSLIGMLCMQVPTHALFIS
jgi:uncharacterized protein with PQ loop repeat